MAILRLESSAFDEPFLCQSRKQPPKHTMRRTQERLYSPGRLKKELGYRNFQYKSILRYYSMVSTIREMIITLIAKVKS